MFIYQFSIAAIILQAINIIFFYNQKDMKNRQSRLFSVVLWLTLIVAVLDVSRSYLLDNIVLFADSIVWVEVLIYTFLFFTVQVFFFFMLYLVTLTGKYKFMNVKDYALIVIPYILFLILLFVSSFESIIFHIGDNLVYQRGFGIYYIYGLWIYYGFLSVLYATKYRHSITDKNLIVIYLLLGATAISSAIQIFFPAYRVTSVIRVLFELLFLLTIQNGDIYVDDFTAQFNRYAFTQSMMKQFEAKTPCAIVAIRIRDTTMTSHTYGIQYTHQMMRDIGDYIASIVGTENIFYMEHKCFALFIENQDPLYQDAIVNRIIERFNSPFHVIDIDIKLNIRTLKLLFPKHVSTVNDLLDGIDALSLGKFGNSSKIIYDISDLKIINMQQTTELVKAIQDGLQYNRFEVYFQPIYSVKENRIVSAEALLRLKNPRNDTYYPTQELIIVAERYGLILDIGKFVLDETCKFIRDKQISQLGLSFVEVNLSVLQCMQNLLVSSVRSTINKYGIEPNQLKLEITETAAAYSTDLMLININQLVDMGVGFAMDDFGIGYSNLDYLQNYQFSIVKIDMHLIWSAFKSPKGLAALTALVKMFKRLNLKIVAEGVETLEQAQTLIRIGIDYLQGFYFAQALPGNELVIFIKNGGGTIV